MDVSNHGVGVVVLEREHACMGVMECWECFLWNLSQIWAVYTKGSQKLNLYHENKDPTLLLKSFTYKDSFRVVTRKESSLCKLHDHRLTPKRFQTRVINDKMKKRYLNLTSVPMHTPHCK